MRVSSLGLPDVKLVEPRIVRDGRGHLAEAYNRRALAELGLDVGFVQDNQIYSAREHTLRGLHYQRRPHAQAKLVRVLRGSILAVVVDLRRGAPTFGRHVAVGLTPDGLRQLLVPAGFAHGFLTLEPGTEVLMKVSAHHAPGHAAGVCWHDPDLGIAWPVPPAAVTASDADRALPRLRDAPLDDPE